MAKPLFILIGFALTANFGSHTYANDTPRMGSVKTDSVTRPWRYSLGLKRGDGMGNSPGVDVSWVAHPWIVLGVTGYYLPELHARGFAIAPSIQFRTSDIPNKVVGFASFGVKHLRRRFGEQSGNGSGGFGALGLEWTFNSGLSLRGGIGFHAQAKVKGQDGTLTISQPSYSGLFLESGLRYYF